MNMGMLKNVNKILFGSDKIFEMYVLRNMLKIVALPVIASGMISCVYEYDDCHEEQIFTIINDEKFIQEAWPEGMAYIFFPKCGGEPWRFDFPGKNAGTVKLPPGDYHFLSFNDDTYSVLFKDNDGFDGYVAYTEEASRIVFDEAGLAKAPTLPKNVSTNTEQLMKCPDMMWGCAYRQFELSHGSLKYSVSPEQPAQFSTDFILTAFQRQLTSRYGFIISDVANLDGVRALSAVFSGLAGSLNLATGIKSTYPVMLSSQAYASDGTMIKGEFVTFGLPEHPDASNILSLLVLLNDGRKYMYQFDVTEQVRNAPDPLEVTVRINGLLLEECEEKTEDGAFDVSVDGWTTIVININD